MLIVSDNERRLSNILVLSTILICILFFAFISPSEGAPQGSEEIRLPQDLLSVSFPNEKDGWACGRLGTILHTTDGGLTWVNQKSNVNVTLSSICFTDPHHGWAVGNMGTIIHTKDGGKAWVKQKSPVSYYLMGVHFTNTQKGWAVGERTNILHTNDGGNTWKVQFADQDYILKSISFCDEQYGFAVGEYGLIYRTENGGDTWKRQAGGLSFSEETGEAIAGNFLFDVVTLNPKTAWATGIDGCVTKTTDGGTTWQEVAKKIKTQYYGIAYKDGKIIICGVSTFVISSDGGKTLKEVTAKPKITYGWLYRVTARGKAGFVAVGKEGWIYLSDAQGTTWQQIGRP